MRKIALEQTFIINCEMSREHSLCEQIPELLKVIATHCKHYQRLAVIYGRPTQLAG